MTDIGHLEQEFISEQKGEGSLSAFLTDGDTSEYIGWDVNPEDLEAIYFEGIGVPRWESLQADSVEAQTALYWERFNSLMDPIPMIGRMRDTDETIEYTSDEVQQLLGECGEILLGAKDAKARRSVQKLSLAAAKATERNAGLRFSPSRIPNL
ncbi:MAG TPA: hypothetical protein VL572_11185 [Pyrinomonadaceae bacterium]|jgi:hypothetical protein|nr:hypothetical protein [Pyrinomonadaceae bacterium]